MKDPAVLFYPDKWFLATKEMKPDCRGWYLNLILHQFDKGSLPNDIEELANLADVRFSEFTHFKQVFEQVLKHKFEQNNEGRLENSFAKEILIRREMFLEKKSEAGKLSYFLKYVRKQKKTTKDFEQFIKENIDLNFDLKDEQVLKQMFEQISELYINVNVNANEDINKNKKGELKLSSKLKPVFNEFYLKQTEIEFYWDVKEIVGLNQIITKLKKANKDKNLPETDEQIINSFKAVLSRLDDPFLLKNATPSFLNSQWAKVIINISSNGKRSQKPATSDEQLRDIIEASSREHTGN